LFSRDIQVSLVCVFLGILTNGIQVTDNVFLVLLVCISDISTRQQDLIVKAPITNELGYQPISDMEESIL